MGVGRHSNDVDKPRTLYFMDSAGNWRTALSGSPAQIRFEAMRVMGVFAALKVEDHEGNEVPEEDW